MEKNRADLVRDIINDHDIAAADKIGMIQQLSNPDIMKKLQQYSVNPFDMVTVGMNGKMEFMNSISTSCKTNVNCQKRIETAINRIRANGPAAAAIINRYLLPSADKRHISCKKCVDQLEALGIPVCICIFCYADAKQDWQHDARNKFIANGVYLETLRRDHELPVIPFPEFRIEAEGDVATVTQARNYIRLMRKNPNVRFAMWTKNPGIWLKAFQLEGGKPENLVNSVLSSRFVNQPDIEIFEYFNRKMPGMFTRLFTVFTASYAKKHHIELNCCKYGNDTRCYTCENSCYKRYENSIIYTNECLR